MKVKTAELTGPALDWAVAKAEGNVRLQYNSHEGLVINNILGWIAYRPSVAWIQGGPIIEREKIYVKPTTRLVKGWRTYKLDETGGGICHSQYGPTPLIAAMRCYITSKLGNEVEIPKELA